MISIFPLMIATFLAVTLPENLSSDLSSDKASYDGDELVLEGHICFTHELGEMQAEQAILKRSERMTPFSQIHLREKVSFYFQNRSYLFCEQADIDFTKFFGTVFSKNAPVHYRDFIEDQKLYLDLLSSQIDFQFNETFDIDFLKAKGNVHVNYGDKYHLDCDHACYDGHHLTAFTQENPCHLTHYDDVIHATKIIFNLQTEILEMIHPSGTISSLFFDEHPGRICRFAANTLLWEEQKKSLTMKENVNIHDDLLGFLHGEDTVTLTQKEQFGKSALRQIKAEGKTQLKISSDLKDEDATLISFGTLLLNRDELLLIGTSPKVKGSVPFHQQLVYKRGNMILYADEAQVEYELIHFALEPHLIQLEGQVRLISKESSTLFHLGYADKATYHPVTGEIRLLAHPGRHVLFWHEEQNLELSAPEILITIDPETKQETIKGIGTVRFSFNETEQQTLHKIFPTARENL